LTQFHQPAFLASSNLYEVNLRQYSAEGSIKAFMKHLPRLKDMGVEILWMMPIHPIGVKNRKGSLGSYYSIKDFEDVNPEFGTRADFKALVTAAHEMGMKVILDWVANHAAWDNVWTLSNPDFFERDSEGNFRPPYDWDDVIQINHHNPAEQQAMINAMKYWVTGFDIDGFRADLAHLTPLPFWINARTQITPLKKDLIWLAETEEIDYHKAFDISFGWKWMHDTEDYCHSRKPFEALIETLRYYDTGFPHNALHMYFTSNHDENSWNGTSFEKYNGYVKALSVFNATWHGIPLIYSGEELPLTKRLDFFDKDPIDWKGDVELHDFYKTLLGLRYKSKAIAAGRLSAPVFIEGAAQKKVIAFSRRMDNSVLIVFINMDDKDVEFHFSTEHIHGHYTNVFSGDKQYLGDGGIVELQPGEYLVLSNDL
jgi:glycosidase